MAVASPPAVWKSEREPEVPNLFALASEDQCDQD